MSSQPQYAHSSMSGSTPNTHSSPATEAAAFFRDRLAGASLAIDLAYDHPRPRDAALFAIARVPVALAANTGRALNALADAAGVAPRDVLLAALATWGARYAGASDVVVTAREPEGREFPLRVQLEGDPSFDAVVARVKEQLAIYSPYLRSELCRDVGMTAALGLIHERSDGAVRPEAGSPFEVAIAMRGESSDIELALEYAKDLFERSTAERMGRHFGVLLAAMLDDPGDSVRRHSMLGDDERRTILVDWNATTTVYPELPIHRIFEEQVAKGPDRVALVSDERTMTYAEVDRAAERLAARLRERGVDVESRVAICVERSIEMIVGLLAILKAGGAYVPLDPTYPVQRLEAMIAQVKPALLLTRRAYLPKLDAWGGATVLFDEAVDGASRVHEAAAR